MLRHWVSVVLLLLPVMTFGWLISSVFIWKLIPTLTWVEGLAIAACVTATDPVLASAVVGKGKFARRVPGHLRNLLSAESGCNDGMAFPFAYLALNCIRYAGNHGEITFHFIVITCLYECVFGCVLGAIIGYVGRHLIGFAEKHNLIDRESFLSFYFVLALFCTGVGSIIGTDDLLVAFAAGTAFSWNGSYTRKTEESHVSNVIDLLVNMSFFVYFGAIVPWEQFNNHHLGVEAWKLVILAILILIFRRLPIMLALKPVIPDIRDWREAFFCGHFGPIGVGAIFISILSRGVLETGEPSPLKEIPPEGTPNYYAIAVIWPVTTFLVIASILVHGSSIAVFTLGKRLNNMTITMSYTTGGNNQSWLQRLPKIEGGRTLSLRKVDTEEPSRFKVGVTAKPAGGMKKKKRGDEPRQRPETTAIDLGAGKKVDDDQLVGEEDREEAINDGTEIYQEGKHIIVEDTDGEVITTFDKDDSSKKHRDDQQDSAGESSTSSTAGKEKVQIPLDDEDGKDKSKRPTKSDAKPERESRRVVAYQLNNEIIVENEDGEVIRRYRVNRRDGVNVPQEPAFKNMFSQGVDKTLSWVGIKRQQQQMQQQQGLGSSPNASTSGAAAGSNAYDHDVEKQEDELVRIDKKGADQDLDEYDEDTVKTQIKSLLHSNQDHVMSTGHHNIDKQRHEQTSTAGAGDGDDDEDASGSVAAKMPRNFLGPQQDDDEDEDHNGVTGVDLEDTEETEVERSRRMAALGLSNDDNDSDDEEFITTTSSPRLNTSTPGIPPAIREEEDDEEPEKPSGIQWHSDVKKRD